MRWPRERHHRESGDARGRCDGLFFSSRRRHTRFDCDWSSDVCSSDYSSLITSAYRLTKDRLAALRRAGLDHVQISVQAADEELSNYIAGTASYRDKLAAYRWTKELGFPLTVNVVLHRKNLHQVRDLILLAESLGAERIELANTQFYGWAFHNRDALMPTRAQLDEGWRVVQEERARLGTKLEIGWVL